VLLVALEVVVVLMEVQVLSLEVLALPVKATLAVTGLDKRLLPQLVVAVAQALLVCQQRHLSQVMVALA
jgi:hypothetical protein